MSLIKFRRFITLISLLLPLSLSISGSEKTVIQKKQLLLYQQPFEEIKKLTDKVTLVSDAEQTKFIVKAHTGKQTVIREVIASEIGQGIVNINKVQIIPNNSLQGITYFDDRLYTLHEYIVGKSGLSVNEDIYQAIKNKIHLGHISKSDKSLAQITAFNIYINNWDCNFQNLFKNEETNQFHVIDMDHSFEEYIHSQLFAMAFNHDKFKNNHESIQTEIDLKNLYKLVNQDLYKFIEESFSRNKYKEMITDYSASTARLTSITAQFLKRLSRKTLTNETVDALKVVDKTLQQLIQQHPPETIYKKWIQTAQEIDYFPNEVEKFVILTCLNRNLEGTKEIRKQLAELFNNHSLISYFKNLMKKFQFCKILSVGLIWILLLSNITS